MTEEEYLRNRMDMINRNSVYGLYAANSSEIAKIIHDDIARDTSNGYDRFNSPPPPIPIRPVKLMTLRDRIIEEAAKELQNKVDKLILQKEDNEMNATSTESFKDIIAIDFELQTFPNPDVQDKFIVSATNRDDIFCFVFEGPNLRDACRKAGLFTSWEKDQKIRELEKENKQNKETADTWSKAYYDLSKKYDLEKAANEAQRKFIKEYAGKDTEVTFNYAIDDVDEVSYVVVEKEYLEDLNNFNKKCNETNSKLREENRNLRSTAKEGDYVCLGSIPYSADDIKKLKEQIKKLEQKNNAFKNSADTWSKGYYNLSEKFNKLQEEYQSLKDSGCHVVLHGMDFTPDQLVDRIIELEALKTPTIENFTDEEPSSRSDILDLAKKCVCGKREQDYGTPESNFQLIADLWNQYLFKEPGAKEIFGIGPMDVAMMMGLMKIARIRNGGGSGDSFVDLAGYAACGGEIWHSNKETNGDSSQETN